MNLVALVGNFGWGEMVVVLFLALLIFGAKRLPEIGRSFGSSLREFKDATKGLADDVKSGLDDDAQPAKNGSGNERPKSE